MEPPNQNEAERCPRCKGPLTHYVQVKETNAQYDVTFCPICGVEDATPRPHTKEGAR